MIKRENLMIGNLVYRPDCFDKVTRLLDTGIIGLDVNRGAVSFVDIEPIYITSEMVIKNGFKLDDELFKICRQCYYVLKLEGFTLILSNQSNTINRDWHIHIDNADCCTIASADIQYVHQMQNIFNLCDVKFDIKL